ncbi:hypothetical protein ABES80_19025 [Bacillus gobiensis]|uniref:hypothetical protein n=1 Tax=Bacillus gobiensis TaxID=1441095 RepID=UPI003D1CFDC9
MNELFYTNLEEKTAYSLTGFQELVSKPIYNNKLLAFAQKKENGNTSFIVIDF